MRIDQKTLDAAGQAPNPIQNCTYDDAIKLVQFLHSSVGIDGRLCINFTVSGAIAAPLVPASEIAPADVTQGEYLFTLVKDYSPDNPAPITLNCAAVLADLYRYPAYDVAVQCLNRWNGKSADEPLNPMSIEKFAELMKESVQDMW